MEQSILVVLVDKVNNEDAEQVSTVNQESINSLHKLVTESQHLIRKAQKLRDKSDQIKRHANKLLKRIVMSHGINYGEDQAVGVSRIDDILFIGERESIVSSPERPPTDSDIIVGKLTKYERRKYDELTQQYVYLSDKINEHNELVNKNESKLISFEREVLKDKEYSKEEDNLLVCSTTGKVFLLKNKER